MGTDRTTGRQGVVVFARDKARVSAFYRETLSLGVEECEPSHDLLRGGGYEVVVHATRRTQAAGREPVRPVTPRDGAALKPTFVVADLEAVRAAAGRTGGSLAPADEAWHIRGCVVLDGCDPEGNVVQFKQRDA
ncbi:MAG: hypothetical protein R2752_16780 [Vicinamibacterales bacterium]